MINAVSPYLGDGFLREAVQSDLWDQSKSTQGVYRLNDPYGFLELPEWKWGAMLSFAKA